MANNPKNELLKWLALKPRTAGWGAVVSYNRAICNRLLLADYINKFTNYSYLDPIDKPVATGDSNWTYLKDWITDRPRLSFEESSLAPGGEANLRMAVVGGTQILIDNVPGHKRAIGVKSIDALDHPELIAESVRLSKTKGTVGKDTGEVVLDLGEPESQQGLWKLTFAHTEHEQKIGGHFFKKYYAEADENKRLYHLGKVAYTDQQYLRPESFKLRTITAKGAGSKTAENFGDGYVEMFVRFEGDGEGGTPPGDDWMPMIPDDVPGEYDSSIVLSNQVLIGKTLRGIGSRFIPSDEDQLETEINPEGFTRLIAKKGASLRAHGGIWSTEGQGSYYVDRPGSGNLYITDIAKFAAEVVGESGQRVVRVSFVGQLEDNQFYYYLTEKGNMPPPPVLQKIIPFWNVAVDIVVGVRGGELFFDRVDLSSSAGVIDKGVTDLRVKRDFALMSDAIGDWIWGSVNKELYFALAQMPSFNVFILNSILFSDSRKFDVKDVAIPGDLVVFGQIGSLFTISPQEHLMGHGDTHLFEVSKDFTGKVEWSVTAIPGSTGAIGRIHKDSGLYESPAIGDIHGTFVRVRVTATDPVSKHSSSALVTVVVRDITVNSVVQICPASSEAPVERYLSANTLGQGILEWKVTRGTGSIPIRAGADGVNTYTAGPKDNNLIGSFTIDQIEVKNLATTKTQNAYVIVSHFPQELTVKVDLAQSSFPDGKAQLIAEDNRGQPVTAIWDVAEGSGSITSEGLYTIDSNAQQPFAIVTARTLNGNETDKDGWIILTNPLFELPDKPAPIL